MNKDQMARMMKRLRSRLRAEGWRPLDRPSGPACFLVVLNEAQSEEARQWLAKRVGRRGEVLELNEAPPTAEGPSPKAEPDQGVSQKEKSLLWPKT